MSRAIVTDVILSLEVKLTILTVNLVLDTFLVIVFVYGFLIG